MCFAQSQILAGGGCCLMHPCATVSCANPSAGHGRVRPQEDRAPGNGSRGGERGAPFSRPAAVPSGRGLRLGLRAVQPAEPYHSPPRPGGSARRRRRSAARRSCHGAVGADLDAPHARRPLPLRTPPAPACCAGRAVAGGARRAPPPPYRRPGAVRSGRAAGLRRRDVYGAGKPASCDTAGEDVGEERQPCRVSGRSRTSTAPSIGAGPNGRSRRATRRRSSGNGASCGSRRRE